VRRQNDRHPYLYEGGDEGVHACVVRARARARARARGREGEGEGEGGDEGVHVCMRACV